MKYTDRLSQRLMRLVCIFRGHDRQKVSGGIEVYHPMVGEIVTGGERCTRCGTQWMGFGKEAKKL